MSNREDYELVRLASGAHSVRSVAEDETFHPVIGPVAEAEALYVRQTRLAERLQNGDGPFVVWDVGLGAAANALTVLRAAQPWGRPLRLYSFDHTVEPLRFALQNQGPLGYFDGFAPMLEELIANRRVCFQNDGHAVEWSLAMGDFPAWLAAPAPASAAESPHLILYDAFSPAKNPAMWTLPVFTAIHTRLSPERPCLMPTYSRSTLLRVTLLLAGFFVGAGHATGEKEETTIASNTPGSLDDPLPRGWLKRARNSTSAEPLAGPSYAQRPLSEDSWRRLASHPQFQ